MTPAARWAAAAQIMDQISAGSPAEKALTNWARQSRFAGSKDRAAIRDHVFDILRCWRSVAALSGGETGRHLVLGRLRQTGVDATSVFTGEGYALPPLTPDELAAGRPPEGAETADMPDWVFDILWNDLGDKAHSIAEVLRSRASVFLRVNTLKSDVASAQAALADALITTRRHPLSETALEVVENPRRIAQSSAFLSGLVELQDVASQAVVEALPLSRGMRVLDYCAGGGGKTLAMAARLAGPVDAYDHNSGRMADLMPRAERAGAHITCVRLPRGPYDLVLADVPCSGSGSWRRAPEAKWRLTQTALDAVTKTQAEILDKVAPLVGPSGVLAYATCSVLSCENEHQIKGFLDRHPDWKCHIQRRFDLQDGGDGFFLAILTRE
ncbi:RsmB/NOP family class I SAM-dependent RNA methyltransferase [Marivita sp. S0852]|uniref:RsmB/NOP family class I SAM-dependent RNA methyltransferase n=1 Tax=Marivita sp. S0852 TaxID=3373893 RepID=UPI003981A632